MTAAIRVLPLLVAPLLGGVAPLPAIALEGPAAQGTLVRGLAPAETRTLTLDGRPVPFEADGRFLLGFAREAGPRATLAATDAAGARTVLPISVAPTRWSVRNLRTLPRGTPRTPEAIARRAAEIARIEAARAPLRREAGWRQRFRWPVTGRISGVFGAQTIYAGEPGSAHGGVDVARATGTPVLAPADGIVALASPPQFSVEGNLLILDHGLGLSSSFLHLSRVDVPVGARVRQGQVIGAVGTTGRSTGPHLHWGLVWRGVRVDPARWAGPMG